MLTSRLPGNFRTMSRSTWWCLLLSGRKHDVTFHSVHNIFKILYTYCPPFGLYRLFLELGHSDYRWFSSQIDAVWRIAVEGSDELEVTNFAEITAFRMDDGDGRGFLQNGPQTFPLPPPPHNLIGNWRRKLLSRKRASCIDCRVMDGNRGRRDWNFMIKLKVDSQLYNSRARLPSHFRTLEMNVNFTPKS